VDDEICSDVRVVPQVGVVSTRGMSDGGLQIVKLEVTGTGEVGQVVHRSSVGAAAVLAAYVQALHGVDRDLFTVAKRLSRGAYGYLWLHGGRPCPTVRRCTWIPVSRAAVRCTWRRATPPLASSCPQTLVDQPN